MAPGDETERRRKCDLFYEAFSLTGADRAAYLDRACAGDASLRATVERLLAAGELADDERFLSSAGSGTSSPPGGAARGERASSFGPGDRDSRPRAAGSDLPPRRVVESLLRKRMLPGAVLGLITFSLFLVKNLLDGSYAGGRFGDGDDRWPVLAVHASAILVFAACSVVLGWRRDMLSVGALRVIELFLMSAAVAFVVQYQRHEWQKCLAASAIPPADPRAFDPLDTTNDDCTLRWFGLIVSYGAYVPNTWRRWMAVMALMVPIPLVTTIAVTRAAHVRADDEIMEEGIWLLVAALLSASGPLAVNLLQRERVESRRIGPYRLGRRLGHGSTGAVFLAEHWLIQRPCAIKLIVPQKERIPGYWNRLRREVKTMAGLTHENIVRVFDYGHTEDDIVYYAMEYLSGLSLQQVVDRYGPMPAGRVVHLMVQACSALGDAHRKGVVHCDIKPANILVCERGGVPDVVKILDFGIARAVATAERIGRSEPSTRAGDAPSAEGTPAFMSPEQVKGDPPNPASDIYSLGATAYFLLTARTPFAFPDVARTLIAHLRDLPAPPTQLRPDIPDDLQGVVLRCLEKEASDRFRDVRDLEGALNACQCAALWNKDEAVRWWQAESKWGSTQDN